MKKLNIKSPINFNNKNIDKIKSSVSDRIYQDPIINKYIKENEIPLSFVNDNLALFLRMHEENKACLNCKGYLSCPKSELEKGYLTFVDADENIYYEKCKYYEDFLDKISKYIYHDFNDCYTTLKFNDLNIKDSMSSMLATKISNALITNKSLYVFSKESIDIINRFFIASVNSYLKGGKKVAYIRSSTLKEKFERLNRFETDKYFDKFNELLNVDILVIEGLGNEESSNFYKYSFLLDLLTYREKNHLLTFISSYYSLKELKEVYGGYNLTSKTNLLISKINELVEEVSFNTLVREE